MVLRWVRKVLGEVLLLNVTHHAEIAHTELRDSAILVASLRLERTEDRVEDGEEERMDMIVFRGTWKDYLLKINYRSGSRWR